MFILPIVSADLITPGYSPIEINNKITNIADYPNYVFIVSVDGKVSDYLIDEELNIVKEEGIINTPYYKFEIVSVYALEKSKFNEAYLKNLTLEEFNDYLETEGVKIIENVPHYKTRPITSTEEVENNFYTISLSEVKEKPDQINIERNNLIYWYICIPILALIIILFILIKRRR